MIFETGQSAFDQFSFGHFIMGATIFLLTFFIMCQFYKKNLSHSSIIFIAFMLTIVLSVGWEVLENSQFYINFGLKYNDTRDSTINMYTDIILDIVGAIVVYTIIWCFNIKFNNRQDKFKKKYVKIRN